MTDPEFFDEVKKRLLLMSRDTQNEFFALLRSGDRIPAEVGAALAEDLETWRNQFPALGAAAA